MEIDEEKNIPLPFIYEYLCKQVPKPGSEQERWRGTQRKGACYGSAR